MLTIDINLCKKDGLCVAECPVSIITMKDKDSVPEAVEGAETLCLRCGHCVAVCPHGALSHEATPLETCAEIVKVTTIDREQAVQFLRSRRSCRVFKDRVSLNWIQAAIASSFKLDSYSANNIGLPVRI